MWIEVIAQTHVKNRYDEYGEFDSGMQKYLRAKKINKIEKSQ